MQQEQHEQLQRLLGEYQDLYLDAQRQRDALAAKVAELDAEAAFWNNHYNAAVEEQRELEMVIERLRAEPRWEPVEDGVGDDDTLYVLNGDLYAVTELGEMHIEFPAGYAICRLVPGQDTQQQSTTQQESNNE